MPALKAALMRTNGSHFSGSASSGKIASTGHSGSQAPQSMHSSGSITSIRAASWMQSTGQTSMHDLSLMSMHGSAMTYVTVRRALLYPGEQTSDQLLGALEERGLRHHLVEPRGVRAAQAGGVHVVRETEERHVREVVGDVVGIDPRDVCNHEVGCVHTLRSDETVSGEEPLQLAAKEEVDPHEQDRGHAYARR